MEIMDFPPAMELGGEAFPTARREPRRDPPQHHSRLPATRLPLGVSTTKW